MKKYLRIYLIVMMCFSCIACAKQSSDIEPEASQMKSICELAMWLNITKRMLPECGGGKKTGIFGWSMRVL